MINFLTALMLVGGSAGFCYFLSVILRNTDW